jgi:hypothetical protein
MKQGRCHENAHWLVLFAPTAKKERLFFRQSEPTSHPFPFQSDTAKCIRRKQELPLRRVPDSVENRWKNM